MSKENIDEKTNNVDEKISIPYNTDTVILQHILDDMKNTGNEGISLNTLWADISATDNPNKSYTLNMAKFLKIIDTDGIKVWLTTLGRSIGYLSGEKRNTLLAQNLPEVYMTMFKWIKYQDGVMFANDAKVKFINNYGNIMSTSLLDRGITSFFKYCQYIGLLKYTGKGRGAKVELTDFGKKVLDLRFEETKKESPKQEQLIEPPITEASLPKDAVYPIKIITRDRIFDYDIKSDTDLTVIDSVINSIKDSWKKKNVGKDKK